MDCRDFRSQFEKETGNNHITEVMGRYNPVYVEWLEQLLQAGQHETIVVCPECESKDISHGTNKMEVFPGGDYYRYIVFDICNDCGYAIDVEFFD